MKVVQLPDPAQDPTEVTLLRVGHGPVIVIPMVRGGFLYPRGGSNCRSCFLTCPGLARQSRKSQVRGRDHWVAGTGTEAAVVTGNL